MQEGIRYLGVGKEPREVVRCRKVNTRGAARKAGKLRVRREEGDVIPLENKSAVQVRLSSLSLTL